MSMRCASSHVMSSVLGWRNPQGREEGWWGQNQGIDSCCKHIGKLVVAELAFGILALSSIVETIAYATLALASIALYPITNKPCKFFAKLLQSSSFTIIWALADIILSPIFINLTTHESFARFWAGSAFFRLDDRLHVADWHFQHRPQGAGNAMLEPILQEGAAMQALIDQGAAFIAQEVLAGASAELVESFKEVDPSTYLFVLTRAVYIYTLGSRKGEEIPDFFKSTTKNRITAFRRENLVNAQLGELVADVAKFEGGTEDTVTRAAFNRLRNIASEESQGGFFNTRCWGKAVEMLSK